MRHNYRARDSYRVQYSSSPLPLHKAALSSSKRLAMMIRPPVVAGPALCISGKNEMASLMGCVSF